MRTNIIFGAVLDENMKEQVKITVIAAASARRPAGSRTRTHFSAEDLKAGREEEMVIEPQEIPQKRRVPPSTKSFTRKIRRLRMISTCPRFSAAPRKSIVPSA